MHSTDINPLILKTIHEKCEDERVARVIVDMLREVIQMRQRDGKLDEKLFKARYKELILHNFKEVGNG